MPCILHTEPRNFSAPPSRLGLITDKYSEPSVRPRAHILILRPSTPGLAVFAIAEGPRETQRGSGLTWTERRLRISAEFGTVAPLEVLSLRVKRLAVQLRKKAVTAAGAAGAARILQIPWGGMRCGWYVAAAALLLTAPTPADAGSVLGIDLGACGNRVGIGWLQGQERHSIYRLSGPGD